MTAGVPWVRRLSVPLVAAPMLGVSGPDLVVAACRAGIAGAFPTANCRSSAELSDWVADIGDRLGVPCPRDGATPGPVCANVIVHRSNPRLEDDMQVVASLGVEVVITSVGSPAPFVADLHAAGCEVWSDVASMRHAEVAMGSGVDGLVLLGAGAGGQSGWANPFAFVRAVRSRFAGTVLVAGGVGDGATVAALRVLGADLAYSGTRFLATVESMASLEHKRMVVASGMDDILLTSAVTGLPANIMRGSPVLSKPATDLEGRAFDVGRTFAGANGARASKSKWTDAWSAGHVADTITDLPAVAELVQRMRREYEHASGTHEDGRSRC